VPRLEPGIELALLNAERRSPAAAQAQAGKLARADLAAHDLVGAAEACCNFGNAEELGFDTFSHVVHTEYSSDLTALLVALGVLRDTPSSAAFRLRGVKTDHAATS
jgi:hypothetical protein